MFIGRFAVGLLTQKNNVKTNFKKYCDNIVMGVTQGVLQ